MNITIEQLKQKIVRIRDTATERSYYPLLCTFFEEYAKSDALKLRNPQATPEETSTQYEHRVGFPDITIRNGNDLIGWVEVKIPQENLNAEKFQEQFSKYKESLENIIFTNLHEWQLWQWADGEAKKTADTVFDLTDINNISSEEFESFLIKFFEGHVYQTRTPKQLALALAKKTRLLSQQVEEALERSEADSDLRKLKETFEMTLIQDISEHQFANMVAETMAYSLFLAALEHSHRDNDTELTLTNAIDYLPTNVPILADLYLLIQKKISNTIPTVYKATQLLVDQLNASEIERIHQKLVEHKPGEDPVIQFYEPFLKEYDPKEREARGVYYTPKPVVDYIVKSVDWLLRNKFNKAKGLADESVHLLDPATGTGTFLMSAIQEIYGNIKKENASLGDEMVAREFNRVVLFHILKHFYGFELLIAPYAIAHLKLTLEVERLGFDFANTKDDNDKDNDRFKVYLANTLDDPNKPPQKLFGFESIPQESEKAREVKKNAPILAIVGNPPYSISSQNQGEWITALISDYKKNLNEQNINALSDDYVKFIRFASWKLNETKQGIFAMITNNTFIDGVVHREMRRVLMNTFDEIYIYNLHGNLRKGEKSPNNTKDENVFDIQQGVSINIFVKQLEKQNETIVKYCDLWGLRENKFATLLDENFNKTPWQTLIPKEPHWVFVPRDVDREAEYYQYESIKNIFPLNGSGIKFRKDSFLVKNHFVKSDVVQMLNDIFDEKVNIFQKYDFEETKDWQLKDKKMLFLNWKDQDIIKVQYRPFSKRFTYYPLDKISQIIPRGDSRANLMGHMFQPNLGLISTRLNRQMSEGYFYVSESPADLHLLDTAKDSMILTPLYLYSSSSQSNLLGQENRKPNLSPDFIKTFSEKLGLKFISEGSGNLEKTFGPEALFYYAYALFHSPTYRSRYAEQLKVDFPHLPLTSDKKLFAQLVGLGNELVNLHLLGENPFDKTKTIFDDNTKWGIKPTTQVKPDIDWKVSDIRYEEKEKRVYVNQGQYFEGVGKEVWEFMIGGYQVCEKWLKDRKKTKRALSTDDIKNYMKIVVSLRETIRIMGEIDKAIPSWPLE